MLRVFSLVVSATLCGCATGPSPAERQAMAEMNDDATCQGYGVKKGTEAYVQCRMNLSNQHAADDAQRRAIVGAYLLSRR